MANLADSLLKKIRAERRTRFRDLDLPPEFVAPNYQGRSIANVAATVIHLLGGEISTPALDRAILAPFAAGVERVVLVVVDALGYGELLRTLEGNPQNGLHPLLRNAGALVPLTSVFPSTTTAALTALWSGYGPAEHGMVGYQLFLREYGVRANMIGFSPVATQRMAPAQLLTAGLNPDSFIPVPSLPQSLAPAGVPVYHLIEQPYLSSALSQVQMRGMREANGIVTSSDLWVVLRSLLDQHRGERALFTAYWSAIDTLAHVYGPDSEAIDAEVNNFAYSFEREFLTRLSPESRRGTLLLITSDHGHTTASGNRLVRLADHTALRACLTMSYTGEPRAAFLYCRQGRVAEAREYVEAHLGDRFAVLDSHVALQAGLFGPGPFAPETEYRIGDLVLIARGPDVFWDRADTPKERGRHGGLLEREMVVPLLIARL